MGRVVVVISYDDAEGAPSKDLAVQVVDKVRPLFVNKERFEVHLANKSVALHIEGVLADRRPKPRPTTSTTRGSAGE